MMPSKRSETAQKPVCTGLVGVPARTNDRRSTVEYTSPSTKTPLLLFRFSDAMYGVSHEAVPQPVCTIGQRNPRVGATVSDR